MICVKLSGGLGNQLFQYATARALALENQTCLCLDQSSLFVQGQYKTGRAYELWRFHLGKEGEGKVYCRNPVNPLYASAMSILLSCIGKLPDLVYTESATDFQEIKMKYNNFVILQGYFQSHHYFQRYRQQLLQEFFVNETPIGKNKELLSLISHTNSVSIHVRRGDYVKNPAAESFHGVCPIDYYQKAIEVLESRHDNLVYFIFSDDISWCRENFYFLENRKFVDCNTSQTAYMDLHLMRHCKFHIIANSSFSWWGAWLANYSQGSVIYPRRWFVNEAVNYSSRFPLEWEGI